MRRSSIRETILVSILAGVELDVAARALSRRRARIVRGDAEPAGAARQGRGPASISDSDDSTARAFVTGLMASLGHAEWFDDEQLFQLAGDLTGAGPAFLFRFIDALSDAAERLGLPHEQATRLAAAMVEGAAALAARSDEGPDQLARRVASPGGTTEAGLAVLDENEALRDLVARTLEASRRRSLEMAAEARTK